MRTRRQIEESKQYIAATSRDDMSRGNYVPMGVRFIELGLEILLDIREMMIDQGDYIVIEEE